jgi:hypothetical protein
MCALFSNALTSLTPFERSYNCLAKRVFASVKAATIPLSAAVSVINFDRASMVATTISSYVCATAAFSA